MTDYKKYINALRKCAKEHEKDRTFIGHTIVSDLCRDTANLLEALEQEPITKNDSGVDCVSRAYLLDDSRYHTVFNDDTGNFEDVVYREDIEKAPSVTLQEPITWIVGKNNAQIAVKNMPTDKLQKICAIISDEQEPILDKIRAEIAEIQLIGYATVDGKREIASRAVLQILDKYKAETEE